MPGLGFLFRKRAAPDPDQWQPGDLAECVGHGRWHDAAGNAFDGPSPGEVRLVDTVSEAPHPVTGEPVVWLTFKRYPKGIFEARPFRRIRPQTDELIECETAFRRLVRNPAIDRPQVEAPL